MDDSMKSRRGFLLGAMVAPVALAVAACARGAEQAKPATVQIENFSAAGTSLGKATVPRVVKTDAEWRRQLSPDSYSVTRRAGTERPFTGKYNKNHEDGLYRCICCETTLFDSKTKFESGTGWPSFTKPIAKEHVVEKSDRTMGMDRTEVRSAKSDSHLGHVFDDGPGPGGLRYCVNSAALRFIPVGKLKEEGYGQFLPLFEGKK